MDRTAFRLRDDRLSFAQINDLARRAEARGYETLFMPDGGGREVFLSLGAIAVATERIKLAPGIATIYSRSPSLLAQLAATLDGLSGGRAVLGLGTGHVDATVQGHGVPFERPLQRMREYVTLIRAILRGERELPPAAITPVTRFALGGGPYSHLPVYVAALGPRMCRLAGAVADGVLLNWATLAYTEQAIAEVRRGAEEAGRDPASVDIATYLRVTPGRPSEATALALARDIASYMNRPFYRTMFDESGFAAHTGAIAEAYRDDPEAAARLVPDTMVEALTIAGDAATVQRRVAAYRALGVALPVLAPLSPSGDLVAGWQAAIDLI